MANVLILGGGFGGVVAAEALASSVADKHQVTLVSRNRQFIFYPALVRLAFGKCGPDDVSFNLRETMLDHRIRFIEGEVARIVPDERQVVIAHGEVAGSLPYDYLVVALGRRLATERITGFFEYAHHLLTVEGALKLGDAVRKFRGGRAVIGHCPGSRLPVPVYETAFALSRFLEERGTREQARITIVSPDPPGCQFGGAETAQALQSALDAHLVEFLPDFPINKITPGAVSTRNGHTLNFNLLMLLPPFVGPGAVLDLGLTDDEGYLKVDAAMRVLNAERIYSCGDSVSFSGPKMGHMAVRQGAVVAANLASELEGREPTASYNHEMMLVIDEGGKESIYVHKDLWVDEPAIVRQGRFWSWAKRIQKKYWEAGHS